MDPALAILDRSLKGDVASLSFLERTSSIYVFDGTNPGQPKICGTWDFLSQALTELERFEAKLSTPGGLNFSPPRHNGNMYPHSPNAGDLGIGFGAVPNLQGHVQLLATMSQRAARRSPISDQKLVEICLTNASYRGSKEQARLLIENNRKLREREMGRLAAMVFDFSYHRSGEQPRALSPTATTAQYQSAFSNPLAMESLCAVVAANTISTGPNEVVNLVSTWIIPSLDNLPSYAVASVTCHLAQEAMGASAPAGINDVLKINLFDLVVTKILAPMLQEAIQESDVNLNGQKVKNQRIASMVLKALERWSSVTLCGLAHMKEVCHESNVNFFGIISDTMYSDSEMIMNSLSEFLETLLQKDTDDDDVLEGLSIVGTLFQNQAASNGDVVINESALTMQSMEHSINSKINERRMIKSELVTAIGLQRFRFNDRLASGDTDVCRSITSIARSVAIASDTDIKSGHFQGSERGLIELLMRSVRHPSVHVCGIALEAFVLLISPKSDLAIKLLPILQGKAIVPSFLVGLTSQNDCDVDFDEFERFREHLLSEILITCYISNRGYFIESCTSAIEEFCSVSRNPDPQTAYQLEAALFCLSAVSIEASKRALLVSASPSAQEAAAKACRLRNNESIEAKDIAHNAKIHDESLGKTVHALCNAPEVALTNPLFLSQMCKFLGKYAKWTAQTTANDIVNSAATLALQSFDRAAIGSQNKVNTFEEMTLSPLADAANAIRNILSRAPNQFATPDALSTLERGWKSMYESSMKDPFLVHMEDKKALCTGITRVLSVLPVNQWQNSLASLTNTTIECMESYMTILNNANGTTPEKDQITQIMEKIGEEMCVLAIAIRTFNLATSKTPCGKEFQENSSLSVFTRVWTSLHHIASTLCHDYEISASLSELLKSAVSLSGTSYNVELLTKVYEIITIMIESSCKDKKLRSLEPIMELVNEIVNAFGQIADTDVEGGTEKDADVRAGSHKIRQVAEQLVSRFFVLVNGIDMLPAMFSICSCCIRKCPILFMSLNTHSDDNQGQNIFASSITVAVSSIDEKHIDVVRSAMMYLKEVLVAIAHLNANCCNICQSAFSPLREGLITKILHGACGNFPREVLDPAATLLCLLLQNTEAIEAEQFVSNSIKEDFVRLGDPGRNIIMTTLGKCAQGKSSISLAMNLFDDVWTLHQNLDNNFASAAGGDVAKKFIEKYSAKQI